MTSQPSKPIRHTYKDVLNALRSIEPATTNEVFKVLEPHHRNIGVVAARHRKWVWQALNNLARRGQVEYIIEGPAYVWSTRGT